LRNQAWGDRQFGLTLLGIDHQLCQHATEVVTEGGHSVGRMGWLGGMAQAPALGFSVNCHALAAALTHVSRRSGVEHTV